VKISQEQNGLFPGFGRQYRHFDSAEEKHEYIKNRTMQELFRKWESEEFHYDFYTGCSEPGYDDMPMICADWNNVSDKFYNWLGKYFNGIYALEWSDEWVPCECGKSVRQSPSSHIWQAAYLWVSDCEIACPECYENAQDEIISYYLGNDAHAVNSAFIPCLEKSGFHCFEKDDYCQRFETGFHPGQNDNPRDVANLIKTEMPDHEYIFAIRSTGQFDVQWSVFIRKGE
jgi:hypothetical protein